MRIAVCGGAYSNPYALSAFCEDASRRGAEALYCLGDLGGYGAEPDAIWPLLLENDITCIAGNYDVAIAAGGSDCGCGYRDPRDQQFAQLMFDYTVAHTSSAFAAWMAELPTERRVHLGGCDVHLVHGSPLGLNDFWWESLPDADHRAKVSRSGADVILATHSGIPWIRRTDGALTVNVGVLGRPPNDGRRTVSYAVVDLEDGQARAEIVALPYDWRAQVVSMRRAGLPEAFFHTNEAGWWATCLEILPVAERARGRFHIYDSSIPTVLDGACLPPTSWPDDSPSLPVRPVVGSPLLPTAIWVEKPADRSRLDAVTGPWGPWRPRPLTGYTAAPAGHVDAGIIRSYRPTLRGDGWYEHPESHEAPLVDPATGAPVPVHSPTRAYQVLVQRVLEQLAEVEVSAPTCPLNA